MDAATILEDCSDLFRDPPGFYPPTPPPTSQTFTLASGRALTLHLVGHSPTEAHRLWNGARAVARFLETDPAAAALVGGGRVLELGAGAGLPSLVCAATLGARSVVATDYPDPDLVANLRRNVDLCGPEPAARVAVRGFVWGADPAPLLRARPGNYRQEAEDGETGAEEAGDEEVEKEEKEEMFDLVIMADLLFRHSEHANLLKTARETLRPGRDSACYVFFTSYRPWLRHKDMAFFDLARQAGFVVEQVLEHKLDRPMFENDPGDLEVQKTVTGWTLRWL